MKTKQIYLEDSYAKEIDAIILEVIPASDGNYRLILDQTVFYAMGGGQATDQGRLIAENWNGEVYMVVMKDHELNHYVKSVTAPTVGMKVYGVINWDRRYKNMRKHSAGHVIDFAMYLLGYSPKTLVALKGDHDKKPYIMYGGILDHDIKAELDEKSNTIVAQDLTFTWDFEPLEVLEREALYLQPGLPSNKPLRALRLEGVGIVADGGTQVHKTSEVGKITIDSVTTEEGNTIIRYSIS